MKYSLKGLVQLKGISHVLKFPFSSIGLGKAMEPWITEELLNRIADELIIKTQNLVVIVKNRANKNNAFLMDVTANEFNENYRQRCLSTLILLVKKHLNSHSSNMTNSSLLSLHYPKYDLSEKDDYKFFNAYTSFNKLRSKLFHFDCEKHSKSQYLTKFISEYLILERGISKIFVAKINDVNIYCTDEKWANTYNATEYPLKEFLKAIEDDLMDNPHGLGNYVWAWNPNDEFLSKFSSSILNVCIFLSLDDISRQKVMKNIFGITYKREIEALGLDTLFYFSMLQSYEDSPRSITFLKAKDLFVVEAFDLFWEQAKKDDFEGIRTEALRKFFSHNKSYSADNGNFLKICFYQMMSSLIVGSKEKNLEIFDFCCEAIGPMFDMLFQKYLCLEFKDVIERFEVDESFSFGIKIIQDFSGDELNSLLLDLQRLNGSKEIYICKPSNAEFTEVLFFNNDWSQDLKKFFVEKGRQILVSV